MSRIGEYRLKAYELLYSKPICEYEENASNRKAYNVLIMGNGWMGNEIFKAIFAEGQSIDRELNITICSQNVQEYKEQVLSTKSGALLPALKMYVNKKHYANLKFINVNIENGADKVGLAPLDFEKNHYNYIVVSLGEAENNWLVASELITQINWARKNGISYSGKIIINVFQEFSTEINAKDQEELVQQGLESDIEINFFGDTSDGIDGELKRIAQNINFSYAMKYNQRISKTKADEEFEKSLIAEFVDSPFDYEIGDMSVVSNFIGANYSADSSFSAAVHIPVKMAVCRETSPDKEPCDTLKEAIRKRNSLYWKLVALEHRRWNAYTIMRGFRAPSMCEEETLLFHDGNTHQDKKNLLHICLCDCSETAFLENDFDQVYRDWIKKKCPKDFPSELDRASLRVHQLTSQLTGEIDIKKVLNEIKGESTEYNNLRQSIIKLANDEENSLVLYQKSLELAQVFAKSISENELEMIDKVDSNLNAMKVRNARTDFLGLDQQLIEMLPFALWYGSKYKTVITISDGSVTATHDVIVPTLFCAKNAIYIGKNVGSDRYQNAIKKYFESRGSNTIPQFVQIPVMNIDSVLDCLEKQVQHYGTKDIVINCVPNRGFDAILAVGKMMEKYDSKISVVQYISNKGIVPYSGDKNIGIGLNNKNYALSEFINLMNGEVTNQYSTLYDRSQYEKLVKFFSRYCDSFKVVDENKKSKYFNPWTYMTNLFSTNAKDYVFEEHCNLEPREKIFMYQGRFSEKVFSSCKISETMKQLQNYQIVQNYTELHNNESVDVSFDYVDCELGTLLEMFEEDKIVKNNSYKALKFIPLNGGIKVTNRLVKDVQLYRKGEHQKQLNTKIDFMQELYRNGFVQNLEIDSEGCMSFLFKDEATMHLLKNQGAVFELIVYYFMCESGLFDDVETGVKIAWDVNEDQPEQVLRNELNGSDIKLFGYNGYRIKRQEILRRYKRQIQSVMNEIDVIGIKGMTSVMVSCKTADKNNMQWIYEIESISNRFQSHGVMAISTDFSSENNSSFKERARQMKVPIWGTETLWNPEMLKEAFRDVLK